VPSKQILEKNKEQVAELGKIFSSNGVYLFDYRGLTVPEMEELRNKVKEHGANLKVVKNRIAIKYFELEKKEHGRELFNGPLAIAYADDNFIEIAKVITQFEKDSKKISVKAGFIEQTFADSSKIKAVAKMPGKDQLLATLAMAIASPLQQMGMALTAPLRDMLILMNNLKDKKEKEEK